MRISRTLMFAIAASFLVDAIAQADEVAATAAQRDSKAIYEGIDDRGRVVRLTITDLHVDTFKSLSSKSGASQAEPHWSAYVGTGTAAEREAKQQLK